MDLFVVDPNVQVAFVSVLVAIVTTSGVVAVAMINRPGKKGPEVAPSDDHDHVDERDILERMLNLISENERKEEIIIKLRHENRQLQGEVRMLKVENAQLILQVRGEGGP